MFHCWDGNHVRCHPISVTIRAQTVEYSLKCGSKLSLSDFQVENAWSGGNTCMHCPLTPRDLLDNQSGILIEAVHLDLPLLIFPKELQCWIHRVKYDYLWPVCNITCHIFPVVVLLIATDLMDYYTLLYNIRSDSDPRMLQNNYKLGLNNGNIWWWWNGLVKGVSQYTTQLLFQVSR